MITEERIREIVREEFVILQTTRQEECEHYKSGSVKDDGSILCDTCGKILAMMPPRAK